MVLGHASLRATNPYTPSPMHDGGLPLPKRGAEPSSHLSRPLVPLAGMAPMSWLPFAGFDHASRISVTPSVHARDVTYDAVC